MENRKPKIILDTNVLLTCIPEKSEIRWIFDKLIDEEFDLFISNDILTEYEEIFEKRMNPVFKDFLIDLLLTADNIHRVFTYFKWNIISSDPDDNKFVDCAVACNVDYIVTYDKHFNVLKNISYPKVNVLNPDEFKKIFEQPASS